MTTRITPNKINQAKPTNFMLNIHALPDTSFWLTTVNIPTISANEVPIPNPVHGYKYLPTNTIVWAPMTLTFLVDEDYANYYELMQWMNRQAGGDISKRDNDVSNLVTTGSIHILSNNKNVSETIFTFHNLFPTIIGELQMQTDTAEPLLTDVTLQYDWMEMEKKNI